MVGRWKGDRGRRREEDERTEKGVFDLFKQWGKIVEKF